MNQLDPSIKTVWALSIISRMLFLTILVFAIEFLIIKPNLENWALPIGSLTGCLFILTVVLSIAYPLLNYKYWKFDVRQEEVYIEHGILTRVKTLAPFRRFQHLDVQQTILERMLGLSKLIIYTAGTHGAAVMIPGLPIEYAEALRDQLKRFVMEDVV